MGSMVPGVNRNLNTGEPLLGAAGMFRATQRIYHDEDHPSALILPVIPARLSTPVHKYARAISGNKVFRELALERVTR